MKTARSVGCVRVLGIFVFAGLTLSAGLLPSSAWGLAATRGPYLQLGTASSLTLRWRTDSAADSVVRYGTTQGNLTQVATVSGTRTEHTVTLSGLNPNTRYYYSVGSSTQTLAGNDASTYFETSPAVGTDTPTRVWVIGDAGTGNSSQAAVYNAYNSYTGSTHTDLWLMLGDNAYDTGTDAEYQAKVFNMYPGMLRKSVVWPTLGNHDAGAADSATQTGPYYNIFNLPANGQAGGVASGTEAYYSFDHANVHFVVLDSQDTSRAVNGAMLTWLTADLQSTSQEWIIAFWHHPPYTKGSHNSDTESQLVQMRQNALPILENYGVDLVLTGHSHSYERSYLLDGHYGTSDTLTNAHKKDAGDGRPAGNGAYEKPAGLSSHQGAVYAVAGSSGKISGGPLNHPAMFVSLNTLGSMVLDIHGPTLNAVFLNSTGGVNDSFTIQKSTACSPSETPEQSCFDGADNDCDGLVDAADPHCCADADGDGHSSVACGGSDCNDSNATIRPGASEVCSDGVDNDCNAAVDCADAACSAQAACNGGRRWVVISNVDDAYVRADRSTTNYGSNTSLLIDTSSVRYHSYIKPNNLGDIPAGAVVVSAALVITQFDAGNNVEVHPVTSSWTESAITYATQPTVGATLTTLSGSANGEKRIDITSLAQQWVNGAALRGVQLYPTGSDGVDYRSSEYGTLTQRPRFEIEVQE